MPQKKGRKKSNKKKSKGKRRSMKRSQKRHFGTQFGTQKRYMGQGLYDVHMEDGMLLADNAFNNSNPLTRALNAG